MQLFRKVIVFLIVLLLTITPSLADEFSNSFIPCDCRGECTCFIQLGDEGNFVKYIIKELVKKKYLTKKTPTGVFSKDVEDAVKKFQADNNLEKTGMMDDDTLTQLIWNMTPNELDKVMPYLRTEQVFIPTDGGKKRHKNQSCSGMLDPRKVSIRNAEKVGFSPAKEKAVVIHK